MPTPLKIKGRVTLLISRTPGNDMPSHENAVELAVDRDPVTQKMRLLVFFPSGPPQIIAQEP